jgi:hypothetical protein
MLSAYIHLCGQQTGGGGGTVTIDYSPQLQNAIGLLQNILTDVRANETATGTRHDAVTLKLESLERVASAFVTLAEAGNAGQEQIKAILTRITEQVPTIVSAIAGFQSASLEMLATMSELLQREFDETQAALNQLTEAVNTGFSQREQTWFSKRITVVADESSVTITVPAGASDISAYIVGPCVPFIVNDKAYALGEQYHRENAASGNTWMVEPQTTFIIPAASKMQVSYRARRDIGEIMQQGGGTWTAAEIDQLVEVPSILQGSGY